MKKKEKNEKRKKNGKSEKMVKEIEWKKGRMEKEKWFQK